MNESGNQQTVLEGFEDQRPQRLSGRHVIAPLLLQGAINAIPLSQLERLTGLDRRTIRRMIQMERRDGVCICVNCRDGYYIAETPDERERCVRQMRHRAAEVYRTASAIEHAEV